jgi:LPPG:FO 2-phospho-L-lactate transferase
VIVALAGGVGGAKLADGLAQVLAPEELLLVINTGDDFEHLGLRISPDLDTVMYTLAGLANPLTGWGLAGETWSFMEALERLGGSTWFRLGDNDLATHIERTRLLSAGQPLSRITRTFCQKLGVRHLVTPMTDSPVATYIRSKGRVLPFQDYFVRERCEPVVDALEYRGADGASAAPDFAAALSPGSLEAVILCPSNPWLSIDPILAIPGIREAVHACGKVLAISPIVAGKAIKGPTAKIMRELGHEPSSLGIALHYSGLVQTLVIDKADTELRAGIESAGIRAVIAETVMESGSARKHLAETCLRLIRGE